MSVGKCKEKDHMKNVSIDGRKTLKLMLKMVDRRAWT
jgi:hypothetical protein